MNFNDYINSVVQIITSLCSWIIEVSKGLMGNFVFLTLFFIAIFIFLVNLIFSNLSNLRNSLLDENDDHIDEEVELEEIDEDFWQEEDDIDD